jgi:hypothetical protein
LAHIQIDFPTQPFDSVLGLLRRSARIYFGNLPFLAAVTLVVFLPGKLALQLGCYLLDIPTDGVVSYLLMDSSDLILSALVIPAVIYGLAGNFRTGRTAPLAESLRWGRRQWGKTLWNKFKVEITVTLWGALLLVPGVVAMVKLIFTDVIVAVEADRETDVLQASRVLSQGHRWRIFFVLLPVMILDLAGTFVVLARLQGLTHSRIALALVDSAFSVGGQWTTVIVLLLYLSLVSRASPAATAGLARKPPVPAASPQSGHSSNIMDDASGSGGKTQSQSRRSRSPRYGSSRPSRGR